MKFKIGDRVKVLDDSFCYSGETGVVLNVAYSIKYPFLVELNNIKPYITAQGNCLYMENKCVYKEEELELIGPKVGEQLLFDFMLE